MNEEELVQDRLNQLIESVNVLTHNVHSTLSYTDERLKAIEKLMCKIEKKMIDQDKLLEMLSKNELIDQLVRRKYHEARIVPLHLQSEEYQLSVMKALLEDEEDE